MYSLQRLLAPDCTQAKLSASSRKRVLEHASDVLAERYDLDAREILDALLTRERLGSTALGDGVAIPHCRLATCPGAIGALISLDEGVDYDAPDEAPVDLLFVLIVPQDAAEEHLQILSQLARLFIDDNNRTTLRGAASHLALFEAMQRLSQGEAA